MRRSRSCGCTRAPSQGLSSDRKLAGQGVLRPLLGRPGPCHIRPHQPQATPEKEIWETVSPARSKVLCVGDREDGGITGWAPNQCCIGLAKNVIWVFPQHLTEKLKRISWLTQYIIVTRFTDSLADPKACAVTMQGAVKTAGQRCLTGSIAPGLLYTP